jgi:hypothetical protein
MDTKACQAKERKEKLSQGVSHPQLRYKAKLRVSPCRQCSQQAVQARPKGSAWPGLDGLDGLVLAPSRLGNGETLEGK